MSFKSLFLFCLLSVLAFAKANSQDTLQDKSLIKRKTYTAKRVTDQPVIDGKPFESFWDQVPTAGNFVMIEPTNGQPERDTHKSEFKIAYDDNAVYVAAYLYDEDPSSILQQFSQRDDVFAQADIFGFFLNTYNNQINQTRFFSTSANSLGDAITEGDREDFSYNVVFLSESTIGDDGWFVEMKIPYRTLRFPSTRVQDWSFQVYRRIRSLNEEYSYNLIDITQGTAPQYDALLEGIQDIDPPLRLNLYPFTSVIHDRFDGNVETQFNAGMDLKYGINDAFTLDATLIPDFGQVAFDQEVLNLGPFEQTFSENRQFFVEGVDLFRKGDIFFSRRIGQRPSRSGNIIREEDEEIVENPSVTKLLNAVKVSGRNKNRLGIGVLNAITEKTEATLRNDSNGAIRKFTTEPLTNYNLIVVDQQFSKNSSVSLTNASTLRSGNFTDANVTAVALDHFDKQAANRYRAEMRWSNRFTAQGTNDGFQSELRWNQTSGKWRAGLGHFYTSPNYDPNDLGLNFRTNRSVFAGDLDYVQFTPVGIFNRFSVALNLRHRRQASPDVHLNSGININPFFVTRERFSFGADFNLDSRAMDQFESRIDGQMVRYAPSYFTGGFISSDYRKKFAIDVRAGRFSRINDDERAYDVRIAPRYRFSDKFLLIYRATWSTNLKRLSFVTVDNNTSILSLRDTERFENTISGTYNFDNRQALTLSFRNFWSSAVFSRDFENLQLDGTTLPGTYELPEDFNPDVNFNVWNLDLSYRWRFAPGSFATVLYRNNISNTDNNGSIAFTESLENLFDQPIRHNISLRISYFLDVNSARSWFGS
ncbi:MAG: DUF5916 domain-containing protein [Nonlabens sp.]